MHPCVGHTTPTTYTYMYSYTEVVFTFDIKITNADANFVKFRKQRGPYKQEELF